MSIAALLSVVLLLLLLLDGSVLGDGGSHVTHLPGFDGLLPFYLETGYVGVDEEENVQLFYYFVKSSGTEPERDPLLLWLTGGPGCSVLSALFYENGPLTLNMSDTDEGALPNLIVNPYSWTQVANILFVDSPVGTGFSYGKTEEATYTTHFHSCEQAYVFLQKWLDDHSEFGLSPFYVAGDSFSGTTVPVITRLIADGNELGINPQINLKGYILGNPVTSHDHENYRVPAAYGMGLIPPDLYESLERKCNGNYSTDVNNKPCSEDVDTFHELVDPLNPYNAFKPACPSVSGRRRDMIQVYGNEEHSEIHCHPDNCIFCDPWANDPNVQESLHVTKGSREKWIRCNHNLNYTSEYPSMIPFHKNLTSRGYRSLIYSGSFDLDVPTLSTLAWISSLNSPVVDRWRPWFVDEHVSGYTRSFENKMTYATVLAAGHVAPRYKPKECFVMFKRWISHSPL